MAFSTTLTADLGAADLIVSVADNTGARTTYPRRTKIDDEIITVTGGVEEGLDWDIERGAGGSDGTDPADHLTGATLAEDRLVGALVAATIAAGEQTVRLLGPYRVNFDTVGIAWTGGPPATFADGGYVQLAAVPDGALITDMWIEIVTPFNGGSDVAHLDIQPVDDPNNSSDLTGPISLVYQDTTAPSVFSSWKVTEPVQTTVQIRRKLGRAISGAALMVYGTFSTPPTAGEADIYALIAEPA